jgi:hypothetical protein
VGSRVWPFALGLAVLAGIYFVLSRDREDISPELVQPTIDAASTQASLSVPTFTANLTRTPIEAAPTAAAPTLSLAGAQEVRQFAASAQADSQLGELDYAAVQVTGPPNTDSCGDFPTAWATMAPNGIGTLTVFFGQLVTPTEIQIHQTFNPGFITQVSITDILGEAHVVYTGVPQPAPQCPSILSIPIDDADYAGNVVTISLNQAASAGGWNQIDAIELIGIKY